MRSLSTINSIYFSGLALTAVLGLHELSNFHLVTRSKHKNLDTELQQTQLDLGRMRDDVCRRAGPNEVMTKGGSFLGREWRFSANAIDQTLPDYARYGYTHVGCNAQSLDAEKLAFTYMVTRPEESAFIPK